MCKAPCWAMWKNQRKSNSSSVLKKISVGKEVAINIFNTRYKAQTMFRHYRIKVKNVNPRTRLSRFVYWIWYLLRAGVNGRQSAYQCRRCKRHKRHGLSPWVEKIPWSRKWQPAPVFLLGKILWTKELDGLQSIGSQKVGHGWATEQRTRTWNQEHDCYALIFSAVK